ncbi:MAG: flavodoxin family protein [Spirochaetales bacterium]|nr:flavodoxin family protein [Spirochaetales bacterium]
MSLLIVTGSPREGMYSDRIGDMLYSLGGGKLVHLREKKIGPCHACDYCKEINIGECIQRDDMTSLYKDIRESDTIAIISPIYWWQVSAQTKVFIDRLYSLEKEDLEGKKFIVIINGAEKSGDKEYSTLEDAFKMMTDYLKMKLEFLGVGTGDEDEWNENKEMIQEFLENALDS